MGRTLPCPLERQAALIEGNQISWFSDCGSVCKASRWGCVSKCMILINTSIAGAPRGWKMQSRPGAIFS